MVSLITLSIPIFFLLIGVELVASRVLRRRVYRLNDSIDDLNCGVVSELRGVLTLGVTTVLYALVFELCRGLGLPKLPDHWATWVVALLGIDLAYYWFHRLSHEVNFLWAGHVVHHQSEDYNLAVALRKSAFQGLFSIWFYLPLAMLGIEPVVFALSIQINTLYQFWIHTRLIGKLGRPIEAVLNTPSHHRVHHGADPKYLDKNYAGMLIIWDRMFGSFEPEAEEPTYGTTKPLARWNPVWANFDYWAQLVREARSFERFGDRVRLFFAHPGWRPEQPVPTPPEVHGRAIFDADVAAPRKAYLFVQFVVMLVVTVGVLFAGSKLDYPVVVALSAWVMTTAAAIGIGFERRPSFRILEVVRLLILPGLIAWTLLSLAATATLSLGAGIAGGFALVSLLALWLSAERPGSEVEGEPASALSSRGA